jgi:hypothetical protein
MPYPKFDYPFSRDYICTGQHNSMLAKSEGPLWVEICADPTCAHVVARCEHEVETDELNDAGLPRYTKSICKWDEDGQVLRCTYCGKDCT